MFELADMVRINKDFPDTPYRKGDAGFIADVQEAPDRNRYILEMADPGEPITLDVYEDDIELIPESERDQVFVRGYDLREYEGHIAHPGEVLQHDFLTPRKLTAYRLAKSIGVPPIRVGDILNGNRGISTDTALRLATYFGNEPEFWLGLQIEYDIAIAKETFDPSVVEPYSV